jgi:hypothetical protein
VTSMILSGLHKIRTAGTASFEVLVSSPPPGSVSRVVGCRSHLSKTPSGTGAEVEAFVDRSSATVLSTLFRELLDFLALSDGVACGVVHRATHATIITTGCL